MVDVFSTFRVPSVFASAVFMELSRQVARAIGLVPLMLSAILITPSECTWNASVDFFYILQNALNYSPTEV